MNVVTYECVVENGCIRLPADAMLPEKVKVYVVVPGISEIRTPRVSHIYSPRLAHHEHAKDLVKEVLDVVDERGNAES